MLMPPLLKQHLGHWGYIHSTEHGPEKFQS